MKSRTVTEMIAIHDQLVEETAKYIGERKKLGDGKEVRITSIGFIHCSDREEYIDFNSHFTPSAKPFIEAIDELINNLKSQIQNIERTLSWVEFETKLA